MGFQGITNKVAKKLETARDHLDMCCQMCHGQTDDGNDFLHEHPHGVRSWQGESVQSVLRRPEVL
eukprot:12425353-Karenia_brevis.AAC.1